MKPSARVKAFTLIELLVVMAVIGIMVGSLGLVLRDGDKSMALQAAQSSLSSLVAGARARAAIDAGQNASIIIWGNPANSETYLRRAAVMVRMGNNPGPYTWVQKGDSVDLPPGVFFVPPNAAGNSFPANLETITDWPVDGTGILITTEASAKDAAYTNVTGATALETIDGVIWDPTTSTYIADPAFTGARAFIAVSFNSYGQLKNGLVQKLMVATGEIEPGQGVIFRNAESARGLWLSVYGIPNLINEKTGFEP